MELPKSQYGCPGKHSTLNQTTQIVVKIIYFCISGILHSYDEEYLDY